MSRGGVRRVAALAELGGAVCQLSGHLQWDGPHPACVGGELRAVGDRRVRLQLRHPETPLLVVGKVQL